MSSARNIDKENRSKPDWLVIRRPGSPVLFAITILLVLGIGWMNDYKSCLRQQHPRAAVRSSAYYFYVQGLRLDQRATIDTGQAKELDIQGAKAAYKASANLHVKRLRCLSVFPPTG